MVPDGFACRVRAAAAIAAGTAQGTCEMVTPEHLRQLVYLQGLDETAQRRLAERCTEHHYDRGAVVLQEGAPCPGLSFVVSGRVKIVRFSPEGRELILRVMGPGEGFNEVPAFDGGPNPASVLTMEPSTIGLVPAAELEWVLQEHPQISRHIVRLFAARLRSFVELVSELSLSSVEARVARLLLVSRQETPPHYAGLGMTQQDMAAMVGTTREVVVRALRSLEERGAITRTEGRVVVTNCELLAAVSEGLVH